MGWANKLLFSSAITQGAIYVIRPMMTYRDTSGTYSFPRPALAGDTEADICIIGAGYTGLWTAYYLKKAQPDLRVAIADHLADGTLTYFAPYAAVHAQNLERVRAALG